MIALEFFKWSIFDSYQILIDISFILLILDLQQIYSWEKEEG